MCEYEKKRNKPLTYKCMCHLCWQAVRIAKNRFMQLFCFVSHYWKCLEGLYVGDAEGKNFFCSSVIDFC